MLGKSAKPVVCVERGPSEIDAAPTLTLVSRTGLFWESRTMTRSSPGGQFWANIAPAERNPQMRTRLWRSSLNKPRPYDMKKNCIPTKIGASRFALHSAKRAKSVFYQSIPGRN
jgi:hypothetical protein